MKISSLVALFIISIYSFGFAQNQKQEKVSFSVFFGANREQNIVFPKEGTTTGAFYGVEFLASWTKRKSVIFHISHGTTWFFYNLSNNDYRTYSIIPKEELAQYDYQPSRNLSVALLYHYKLVSRQNGIWA
jgi:hypothetical protein